MKTLHHTETTWNGRKIIIDAADLTAECGYIEVMAMYPDGREIECYHTHDPKDARLMFNHYCDLAADRPTADTYTRADWERSGRRTKHHEESICRHHHRRRAGGVLRCRMPYHHVECSPCLRLRQRPPASVLCDLLPLRPSLV